MQYTQVGRTGLKVSRFCLGLESFYVHRLIGEEEAFAIINRALELGVNLFNVGEGEIGRVNGPLVGSG